MQLSSQDLVVSQRDAALCYAPHRRTRSIRRSGSRTRNTWDMSPLSYHCSILQFFPFKPEDGTTPTGSTTPRKRDTSSISAPAVGASLARGVSGLRPRVRRGQPVEGWDLHPYRPDPQSGTLLLSYLPHVFCGGGFEPPTSCSQGRPVTATVSTDKQCSCYGKCWIRTNGRKLRLRLSKPLPSAPRPTFRNAASRSSQRRSGLT